MPAVYRSGDPIPDLDGVIGGASTLVFRDPAEIVTVQAICSIAERPMPRPLEAVHALLTAPYAPYVDFSRIASVFRIVDSERWFASDATSPLPQDSVELLRATLTAAHQLWVKQEGRAAGLRVALAIADPSQPTYPFLTVDVAASPSGLPMRAWRWPRAQGRLRRYFWCWGHWPRHGSRSRYSKVSRSSRA